MNWKGGLYILKKYCILLCVFFMISATAAHGFSLNLRHVVTEQQNGTSDIQIKNITDGICLTVELYNQGSIDATDVHLTIDVKKGSLLFVPQKTYTISSLPAQQSTTLRILLFGFNQGIFQENPLVMISVESQTTQMVQTIVSLSIRGMRTTIRNELFHTAESFEGYTLFSPEYSKYTYLINNKGLIVRLWKSEYIQGLANYLLPTGELLRLDLPGGNPTFRGGGIAGRVEKFDTSGTLIWGFEYSTSSYCAHHDVEPLPSGNILLIAWEYKTRQEAIDAGRDPAQQGDALWPDHIIEVEPTGSSGGTIVWEWHVWDHLIQEYDSSKANYGVVADHPELIDLNYVTRTQDWNHINAIDYNEELDQILVSVHEFNEIWVIDHSTTTDEAASHSGGNGGKGGDLLYRWGNPEAYQAGTAADKQFFGQHGVSWVETGCPGEGNILVFNNGQSRRYSSVDEIIPPLNSTGGYTYTPGEAYGPDAPVWVFTTETPTDMYSPLLSNAQRLPNGNTLICSAQQGLLLEVTPEKAIVWKYRNFLPTPFVNAVARAFRYPPNHPGSTPSLGTPSYFPPFT